MKLNRTDVNWDRVARNEINENWDILENSYNNLVNDVLARVTSGLITPSDTTFAKMGKNKFDGVFVRGHASGVNEPRWNKSEAVAAIVRVEPGKRYVISKSNDTNRFRVYSSKHYPRYGDEITHRYINDSETSGAVYSEDDNYIIVNLSTSDERKEPSQFMVEERESGGPTQYEPPRIIMDLEKESVSSESLKHISNIGVITSKIGDFVLSFIEKKIKIKSNLTFVNAGGNRYRFPEGEWSYSDNLSVSPTVVVAYDLESENIIFLEQSDKNEFKKDTTILLGYIRDQGDVMDHFLFGIYGVEGGNNKGDSSLKNNLFFYDDLLLVDEERSVPSQSEITSSYIYDIYDDLVADYPSYVTKDVFGTASDDSTMYRYDFKPPSPLRSADDTGEFPKVFVLAGIHGHEQENIVAVARFFDNLCREWRGNKELRQLRFGVHFVVVPVGNPWGLNNYANGGSGVDSRKTANGVDINSDFPTGWSYNPDPEATTTTGEEPLSQPESQAIYEFFENNKDIVLAISTHNFGNYPADPGANSYALWYAGTTPEMRQLLQGVGTQLIAYLKDEIQFPKVSYENSMFRVSTPKLGGVDNEIYVLGTNAVLLEMAKTIHGGNVQDEKVQANKFGQEALGNLILGVIDKYPYL